MNQGKQSAAIAEPMLIHTHSSHSHNKADKQAENLNTMLDSLKQQLLADKLKLRKTRSLLLTKRQLLLSTHTLLVTEFHGVFSDTNEQQVKRRRRRHARPFGLVPLLGETVEDVTAPAEQHRIAAIEVKASAWYSKDDDIYWVRAHVHNTLK